MKDNGIKEQLVELINSIDNNALLQYVYDFINFVINKKNN